MIEVTPGVSINESDLSFDFIRSSGPGGQNVNKVASGVQLRFNIAESSALPDEVKTRLHRIARNRISEDGTLIIEARRYRTQEQNRQEAIERLVELVRRAAVPPKPRKKTRPSEAAKRLRLEEKRKHSQKKQMRRQIPRDDHW